jgi:hypothetical protein
VASTARTIRQANGCFSATPAFFKVQVAPPSTDLKTPRPKAQA